MYAFITPVVGGLLIGCSAVLLLLVLGQIAGISGVIWAAISGQADSSWRWLFLIGLVTGPVLFHGLSDYPYPVPSAQPWWVAILGGILVGIGVKMGNGCTSGHGVCGIGRLSFRSLVATLTFMATGIITVYITHHQLGSL